MIALLSIFAGLALLLGGAELLVSGASRLARAAGITPLVVGLTVVAYGTSAPELAVSLQAALAGSSDLSVGNAVGSNSFNLLVVLGAAAALSPLRTTRALVRLDVPLMLAATLVLWGFAFDGTIDRWEGVVAVLLAIAYTALQIRRGRREAKDAKAVDGCPDTGPRTLAFSVLRCAVGLGLLVLGARVLVDGAVAVAAALGVSQLVIGLTIVAAGTSLPEVATSLVAAARGERDLAIGNVVGSNVFNMLCVLGTAAATADLPVSIAARSFDFPVMLVASLACLPILASGWRISRPEGSLMLTCWVLYTLVLIGAPAGIPAPGPEAIALIATPLLIAVLASASAARRGSSTVGDLEP